MATFILDQLQYADDRKGPFRLYIFDKDGMHNGSRWFRKFPKYSEEITIPAAQVITEEAVTLRKEVRITDSGDMLVYHAIDGKVVYPAQGDFWQEVFAEEGN